MMKKRVRKRIPFFMAKGVPVPQFPQRHASCVKPTFQQKKWVPIISISSSFPPLARSLPFVRFMRTHSGNLNQVTENIWYPPIYRLIRECLSKERNLKSISKGIGVQSNWLVSESRNRSEIEI